jgi:asparagine synthase (glutamine-hydrolysing)
MKPFGRSAGAESGSSARYDGANEPRPLSPIEIAAGVVYGTEPISASIDWRAAPTPRATLERVVESALSRPPCVVSFSGGRDSSAILALAAHVAKREGLAMPIPVTLRFPHSSTAGEDEWQELVIRHLGLTDWVRIEPGDELDLVGRHAQQVLRRFGLTWPFNAHFHMPIVEQARGGVVLTGVGGDEMLSAPEPWLRINLLLARKLRASRRDVVRICLATAPMSVRRRVFRRWYRPLPRRPWLTAEAERELDALDYTAFVGRSFVWGRMLRRYEASRHVRVAAQTLRRIGSFHGTHVVSPFFHPTFFAAVARHRPFGFHGRANAMSELFGDLLPVSIAERSTKSSFDDVFWTDASSEFARTWDGDGVDERLVDPRELRAVWTAEGIPPAQTYTLLQSVWAHRFAKMATRPASPADR